MNDLLRFGGCARVGLAVLAVLMVGLAGCAGASGPGNVDDAPQAGDAPPEDVQTTELAETTATQSTEEVADVSATSAAETAATAATTTSASTATTTDADAADTERLDSDGGGSDGGDNGVDTGASNSADGSGGSVGDPGDETGTQTGTPPGTETETPQTDDGSLPEIPEHEDSTFDVAHSRTIASSGDGTTTVSGYVVSTIEGYTTTGLVMVVEVYDHDGNWIGSEWIEVGDVTRTERTPYSVTFDLPREAIGSYAVDANRMIRHADDAHHQYAGQCPEIEGDGPNDQEAEGSVSAVVEGDTTTVVVGEVFNGENREMAIVRVFASIYDGDGNRLATKTVLLEDVPGGDRRTFAVPFDESGIADARVDADEVGIGDGGLACRPPL